MIWNIETPCALCQEGPLYFWKNVTVDRLYLHCAECESGYPHPDHVTRADLFQTLTCEYDDAQPTWEEICAVGWQAYVVNADRS